MVVGVLYSGGVGSGGWGVDEDVRAGVVGGALGEAGFDFGLAGEGWVVEAAGEEKGEGSCNEAGLRLVHSWALGVTFLEFHLWGGLIYVASTFFSPGSKMCKNGMELEFENEN